MTSRPGRRERRRAAAAKRAHAVGTPDAVHCEMQLGSTALHDERLRTVVGILIASGARTVLDLGCGSGALLERLIGEVQFTAVVGIDSSVRALHRARLLLEARGDGRVDRLTLVHGSFAAANAPLAGFDAAAMVETIEHVPSHRLSGVERTVFAEWRPSLVVITTPNREYNVRFGLAEGEYRSADHHFEWCRSRFRGWSDGVASRNGYEVECSGIGPLDPLLGSPTQLAVFSRPASGRRTASPSSPPRPAR
jgi:small RNA 2'-O-methyltransferase